MFIFDCISVLVLISAGIYSSVTDISNGIIRNKTIIIMIIVGLIFNSVNIVLFSKGLSILYIANVICSVVVALLLYATHIWAAGDSKFVLASAFLMPPIIGIYQQLYIPSGLYITIVAFAFSFIYVFTDSIKIFVKNKGNLDKAKFVFSFKKAFLIYLRNVLMITVFYKIEIMAIPSMYRKHIIVFSIINCLVVLIVSCLKKLEAPAIVVALAIVSLAISFGTHIWFVKSSEQIYSYVLVIVLMVIRTFINEYNYEDISVNDLKKGMILSLASTILMSQSRVEGLPGLSSETLKSRLTEEEVKSVIRWSNTPKGCKQVTIVKKMPFGIFLFIGCVGYIFNGVLGIWFSM